MQYVFKDKKTRKEYTSCLDAAIYGTESEESKQLRLKALVYIIGLNRDEICEYCRDFESIPYKLFFLSSNNLRLVITKHCIKSLA